MEVSIRFYTVKSGWFILLRVTGYNFKINIIFLSLEIYFVSANGANPDEMLHYVTFQRGLHCLLYKSTCTCLMVSGLQRVK